MVHSLRAPCAPRRNAHRRRRRLSAAVVAAFGALTLSADTYTLRTSRITVEISKARFGVRMLDPAGKVINAGDLKYGSGYETGKPYYAYSTTEKYLYTSIPFFTGLKPDGHAYGIFFDNTHRSYHEMAGESPDYCFFDGPAVPHVVERYTELSGRHPQLMARRLEVGASIPFAREHYAVTAAHPALRDGAQIDRFAASGPGSYAFSRIDATEQVEYVVAVNNATTAQSANVRTYSANTPFTKVYPAGNQTLDTNGAKELALTVPPLSTVVYRAAVPLAKSGAAPPVALNLLPGGRLTGRAPVGATVAADGFTQVTFAVKVGDAGRWTLLGTDDNPGYKVYFDTAGLAPGTRLLFRAVAMDDAGHMSVSQPVVQVVGANPAPTPSTSTPAPTPST